MSGSGQSRESWIVAAVDVIGRLGPDAVAVEPLAKDLGVSKGSFYWHFRDRGNLVAVALDRYQEVSTAQLITDNERRGGTAGERLRRLFDLVVDAAARYPGDLVLITGTAPEYARVREEIAAARIAYLRGLLVQAGVPASDARPRAVLAFAGYVSLAQLSLATPKALGRRRRALPSILSDLLLPPGS